MIQKIFNIGITDSLNMFRKKFESLKLPNHKLTFQAKEILKLDENILLNSAHDALFDVQILQRLVIENLELDMVIKNAVSFDDIFLKIET